LYTAESIFPRSLCVAAQRVASTLADWAFVFGGMSPFSQVGRGPSWHSHSTALARRPGRRPMSSWCQKSQRPETSVVRPPPGLGADQYRRRLAAAGRRVLRRSPHICRRREVMVMGRRDLIRRERAKLAAAEMREAAASGPAAPLPTWLGTGGTVASSESTWVRSVPSRTTSTPEPPRPASDGTRRHNA